MGFLLVSSLSGELESPSNDHSARCATTRGALLRGVCYYARCATPRVEVCLSVAPVEVPFYDRLEAEEGQAVEAAFRVANGAKRCFMIGRRRMNECATEQGGGTPRRSRVSHPIWGQRAGESASEVDAIGIVPQPPNQE